MPKIDHRSGFDMITIPELPWPESGVRDLIALPKTAESAPLGKPLDGELCLIRVRSWNKGQSGRLELNSNWDRAEIVEWISFSGHGKGNPDG